MINRDLEEPQERIFDDYDDDRFRHKKLTDRIDYRILFDTFWKEISIGFTVGYDKEPNFFFNPYMHILFLFWSIQIDFWIYKKNTAVQEFPTGSLDGMKWWQVIVAILKSICDKI